MITVIPFEDLGAADMGWLNAKHHFSFAHYHDPDRMGVGALRVWNDDTIAPHTGFDPHPHRDMEIITYVRKGAITHEDSLGNKGRTAAGDVQVMSAGTGIVHSEYNREDEPTTLFQIWIHTDAKGHEPRWDQRQFPKDPVSGALPVLASGDPDADGGLLIHQDARILGGRLNAGDSVTHELADGRAAYLVVSEGAVTVNGQPAGLRAGVTVTGEPTLTITATADAEVVLADVPQGA
ncbi:MAG: pirin family protein [Rhodospirillaceae bacterium]